MSEGSIQEKLEKEAGKALVQRAFFRAESAIIVAATILLTVFAAQPFPWWPQWGWLALGLISYIAVAASTLTDPGEREKVVDSLFREKYDIKGIRDDSLRRKLEEADKYRSSIQAVVDKQPKGPLRDRVKQTADQVSDWIASMVELARQIDGFRNDPLIYPRRGVPKFEEKANDVQELKRKLRAEVDPQKRDRIARTLASAEQELADLEQVKGRMDDAELRLDQSLSALGSTYSQMLLVSSRDVNSDQAERLQSDIRNEVLGLRDLTSSLDEVYNYQAQSMKTMLGAGSAESSPPASSDERRPPTPPKQSSAGR